MPKSNRFKGLPGTGEVADGSQPAGTWHESGPKPATCYFCERTLTHSLRDYAYEFGMFPRYFDFATGEVIENEHYRKIIVCGTDLNLVKRIARIHPHKKPQEIIDICITYRKMTPIGTSNQLGEVIPDVPATSKPKKPAKVVHLDGVSYCTSCGNQLVVEMVAGLQIQKCGNKLCSANL